RALFIASDAQYGYQLYSTDGTSILRLTNATQPANSSSFIAIFHASIAGTAYVSISDGAQTTTSSLWRTDGTVAGTRLATGVPPVDLSYAGLTQITGDGSTVYIERTFPSVGTSLLKYEPLADHTTGLKSGLSTSIIDGFLFEAGTLYFSTSGAIGD